MGRRKRVPDGLVRAHGGDRQEPGAAPSWWVGLTRAAFDEAIRARAAARLAQPGDVPPPTQAPRGRERGW